MGIYGQVRRTIQRNNLNRSTQIRSLLDPAIHGRCECGSTTDMLENESQSTYIDTRRGDRLWLGSHKPIAIITLEHQYRVEQSRTSGTSVQAKNDTEVVEKQLYA